MNAMSEIAAPVAIDPKTIRVSARDLRRAVAQVGAIVERRNSIPVLGCLLVRPGTDKLEITGTDLDTLLTVECAAECGTDAQPFIIAAPLLKSLLTGADAGDAVEITRAALNDQADVLTIRIGPAVARLRQLQSVDDFPLMAVPTCGAVELQAKASTLAKILSNCAPCISTEETRYYLNGIYAHARDGALAGVATDGHRLSLYQTDVAWPLADHILPRKAVAVLSQLLGKAGDAEVAITGWADTTRLRISGPGWVLIVKTIDATFPDYTRVIPKRRPDAGYVVLSPATLRRIPHLTDRATAAEVNLEKATLTVRDRCADMDFVLPIEAKGSITVGYNANYLRDLTHAYGTVRIEATSAGDAATVLSEDPNWLGVLMPMRF